MIRCFFHIHTGVLTLGAINGTRLAREEVKFLTTLEREIVFHDGTNPVALPAGSTGAYVARAKPASGAPVGALRVWDVAWEAPAVQGDGYIFRVPIWGATLEQVEQNANRGGERLLAAAIHLALPSRRIESQTFEIAVAPAIWSDSPTPDDPESPYPLPGEIVQNRNLFRVTVPPLTESLTVDISSLELSAAPTFVLATVACRGAAIIAAVDTLAGVTASAVPLVLSARPSAGGATVTLLIAP